MVPRDAGKPAAAVVPHLVPLLFGADVRPHLAQCFELLPAQGAFVLAELSWLNAMSLHPIGPLSLHPHILVWLLQAPFKAAFQGRCWG